MVGSGFGNIFKIPELRKRLFYTAALLAVYRIGVYVPTPGVDTAALKSYFDAMQGTIF
ncbi:MAG: preprotein translocase subunit SecY, partial [Desulfobacterales bacterium]|nr:preprotein translocase subunit SecY [Desulfobacterales bacterium]